EKPAEHNENVWSVSRSLLTLLGASVLAALLSEILVGSAEGAGHELGMSEAFVGLICVAVVGGAAESLSAISVASKNRMDLSLGISLGSSIQIALFVAPVLVLSSYFIAPRPFHLIFNPQLLGFLLLSVLLSAIIAGDGRSNWYKGVQLIVLYLLLALTLYLLPAK
ncbi:MAG: cation transporter, partial [Proteobacteria bacterium]